MSVYQKKFIFNGKSNTNFGLIVCAFLPDDGESDSYLTMESVYTDSFDGSVRHDYGAKYTERAVLYITMVKNNYTDMSRQELREALNWLTGLRKVSWLDLYKEGEEDVQFSFLGRVTDVKLQKLDSRVVGLKIEFTSVNPWAYSGIKRNEMSLDGSSNLYSICNCSDEDGVYVYPKVTFINKVANGTLRMLNVTTNEETLIQHLAMNEKVTMDSNKIIYSDNATKVFGDDFNFNWLRFAQGYNTIDITGTGHLLIEHRDIMKVADAFDDNDSMTIIPADKNSLFITEINLPASNWIQQTVPAGTIATYAQPVAINNVTANSLINLQPDENQLLVLQANDIELQIINNNGTVTAYAYGSAPVEDYEIQATIEETNVELAHRYATVNLYSNAWVGEGSIYTQTVYIKDLTSNSFIETDLTDEQTATLEGAEATLFIKNENGVATAYSLGFRPELNYSVNIVVTETVTEADLARRYVESDIYAEPLYF